MKPRFTFALVRKLAARALFAAALLALPRALVAQTAEDLYKKGLDEMKSRAPDAAIADFTQAVALDPNYAPAYYQRGLMKVFKKDYDGGMADYARAIQLNPNYARVYSARGNVKVQKKDFDGAIADCDRAIALDPKFAPAYVNRGNAKAAKKDFDGAIADFNQAIALNPQKAGLANRARALAMIAKQNEFVRNQAAQVSDTNVDASTPPPLNPSDIDPDPDVPAHPRFLHPFSQEARSIILHDMQIWGQGGGFVQVGCMIDTVGRVRNPFIISSTYSDLDQPALEALSQSRYWPALRDGVPVNSYAETVLGYYMANNKYMPWGDVSASGPMDIDIPDAKIHLKKLPPELQYDTPPETVSTVYPVYPMELLQDGHSGVAQAGFLVSPTGKVVSPVSIHATRPEFGMALLAMVEQMKFRPAMKEGKPCWAAMTIRRKFSKWSSDVQVNDETMDLLDALQKNDPSICLEQELDAQSKAISSPPPIFPSSLVHRESGGQAVVAFLIDKDGAVQLPHAISATDPAFGYAAVQGVSAWKFAPPTSHGKPVVVQTSMPITFNSPLSAPPSAISNGKQTTVLIGNPPASTPQSAISAIGIPADLNGAPIFNLADLDQKPHPLVQIAPEYPFEMKNFGVNGTVVVGFIVDFNGNVEGAQAIVSSGHFDVDQAAVDGISKWQYAPGRKDGHAVNTYMQIPISYNITNPN